MKLGFIFEPVYMNLAQENDETHFKKCIEDAHDFAVLFIHPKKDEISVGMTLRTANSV